MVVVILWAIQWCSLGLAARVICDKLYGEEDAFGKVDTLCMTALGGAAWAGVAVLLIYRVWRTIDELNWKAVWELLNSDKDGREE